MCQLLRYPQHWYYGNGEGAWLYYIYAAWVFFEAALLLGR